MVAVGIKPIFPMTKKDSKSSIEEIITEYPKSKNTVNGANAQIDGVLSIKAIIKNIKATRTLL